MVLPSVSLPSTPGVLREATQNWLLWPLICCIWTVFARPTRVTNFCYRPELCVDIFVVAQVVI